jgi:hypothetical protein
MDHCHIPHPQIFSEVMIWSDCSFSPYYRRKSPPTMVCLVKSNIGYSCTLRPCYHRYVKDIKAYLFKKWSYKVHRCCQTVEDLQCKENSFLSGRRLQGCCAFMYYLASYYTPFDISRTKNNWLRYLFSHSNTFCYCNFMPSHLFYICSSNSAAKHYCTAETMLSWLVYWSMLL